MSPVSHGPDRLRVVFDEPNLVANAGLVTVATLADRLGLEGLVDESVKLRGVGAANAGEKFLTLVHTLVAGGSHIDHVDMLRAGDSEAVLSHRVVAPSTLGTFLRSFGLGSDRQLDVVFSESLRRVWSLGVGPGDERLFVDLDGTVCEVFGDQKQGVAYGYTGVKGYHPLIASVGKDEILGAKLRRGSSHSGADRFASEVIGRVRRAGATGEIVFRADSEFWSRKTIDTLERHHNVSYSITVKRNDRIETAIASIPEEAWTPIGWTDNEEAQVAETSYVSTGRTSEGRGEKTFRLIVRRTRTTGAQGTLFAQWRHHAFVTNRDEPAVVVEREHRQHATVELAIRDLKEGAGLSHLPSGDFWANTAWLTAAALAHNLIRWTNTLGDPQHRDKPCVAATFRTQLVALPARLVNHAGQLTLRLPQGWPWAERLQGLLTRLRHLPQAA